MWLNFAPQNHKWDQLQAMYVLTDKVGIFKSVQIQ